jgi:carboxymethylenebutenolidase
VEDDDVGKMIQLTSNGDRVAGYLAEPASGHGPAVVVLQEWWGLVDHIKDVADRFAAEGFVALAPDLYRGQSAASPDAAGRLMMALDIDRAVRDVRAAVDYLLILPAVTSSRVGVIGFCMGGQLALATACADARIGACADFYGVHPSVKLELGDLEAPVLGVFAENDTFVTPEVARKLAGDLRSARKQVDLWIVPGVTHAFFNDTRPDVYDVGAAAEAWSRTLTFFRASLA